MVHVIPLGDIKEHVCSQECWCRPEEDAGVVVHHAADRRELYEEHTH